MGKIKRVANSLIESGTSIKFQALFLSRNNLYKVEVKNTNTDNKVQATIKNADTGITVWHEVKDQAFIYSGKDGYPTSDGDYSSQLNSMISRMKRILGNMADGNI